MAAQVVEGPGQGVGVAGQLDGRGVGQQPAAPPQRSQDRRDHEAADDHADQGEGDVGHHEREGQEQGVALVSSGPVEPPSWAT